MKEDQIKINQENCSVDKRSLKLDVTITEYSISTRKDEENNYVFFHTHWHEDHSELKINGIESNQFKILELYKHCLQCVISTESDAKIFIDRRYEHNNSYDIYFKGKHYLVGTEE